jgi:hypothetical protein
MRRGDRLSFISYRRFLSVPAWLNDEAAEVDRWLSAVANSHTPTSEVGGIRNDYPDCNMNVDNC